METIQITARSPSLNCSSSPVLLNGGGWASSSRRVSAEQNSCRNLPLNCDELEDYLELIELPGLECERTTMTPGGLEISKQTSNKQLTWRQRWFCCCLEPTPTIISDVRKTPHRNKPSWTQRFSLFGCGKADPLSPNLQPMCHRFQSIAQISFNDQEPMHFRMLVTIYQALVDPLEVISDWRDHLESHSPEVGFDHRFLELPFDANELRQLPVQPRRPPISKINGDSSNFRVDSLSLLDEGKEPSSMPQLSNSPQSRKLSPDRSIPPTAFDQKNPKKPYRNERSVDERLQRNSIYTVCNQGPFEQALTSLVAVKNGPKVDIQAVLASKVVCRSNQENAEQRTFKMHSQQDDSTERFLHSVREDEKRVSSQVAVVKSAEPETFKGNAKATKKNVSATNHSSSNNGVCLEVSTENDILAQQYDEEDRQRNANEWDNKTGMFSLWDAFNEPMPADQRPETNVQTLEQQNQDRPVAGTVGKNCPEVASCFENQDNNEKYSKDNESGEDEKEAEKYAKKENSFFLLKMSKHSHQNCPTDQSLNITDQRSFFSSSVSLEQCEQCSENSTPFPSIIPERGWMINTSLEEKEDSEVFAKLQMKPSNPPPCASHFLVPEKLNKKEIQMIPERLPVIQQSSSHNSRQNSFYSMGSCVRKMNSFRSSGFVNVRRSDASATGGLFSRDASARQSRAASLREGFGNSASFWLPRYGPHWQRIGFQGHDPGTDLRCVGMLFESVEKRCKRNPSNQNIILFSRKQAY